MTNRLVLLFGEFSKSDQNIDRALREWSSAGLLGTVAWASVTESPKQRPIAVLSEASSIREIDLFELLTSRIWNQISVVAVREANLATLNGDRFDAEVRMLNLVEEAFIAHKDLEFTSFTVSIADESGIVGPAFPAEWKHHLLQEPVVRIDEAVASQPLWDDQRHLLVALLALTTAGGFVWQFTSLINGLVDPVQGNDRPVRIGRAYLRVVSAGRLTDEVLSGAFPASGPWSIPPDVPNARAVPPGSYLSENVIGALRAKGRFNFLPWVGTAKERPTKMGIWDGLKLFLKEFLAALKGIPLSLVAKVKGEIEDWLQKVTFGSEANVLLKFDPKVDDLNSDDLLGVIRALDLGAEIDPVGDSIPWTMLQQVALSSVDGGRFPLEIPEPTTGSFRLIYTDPVAIGPSPHDVNFSVGEFEKILLGLKDEQTEIEPMALEDARTFQIRLDVLRAELAREMDEKKKTSPSGTPSEIESKKPVAKAKKIKFWQIRKKKKAKKNVKAEISRQKSAAKAAEIEKKLLSESVANPIESESETAVSETVVTDTAIANTDVEGIASKELDTVTPKVATVPEISDYSRHKPTNKDFNPTEYVALCAFYQGSRTEMLTEYSRENSMYEAAVETHKAAAGLWSLNKSCDHCGTAFDHGVLYLHEPTNELVHVGHICARKTLPLPDEADLLQKKFLELEKRWLVWLSGRSGSLLWRVGQSILTGLINARTDLSDSLLMLEKKPQLADQANEAQLKFGRWTRRGVLIFILLIAASVASIVFTPLPLLLFSAILVSYFSGFIIKLLLLARDLVRAQYRLRLMSDDYERAYSRARHDVGEIVRISSVREQFEDWQIVLRELVHMPFGQEIGFSTGRVGLDDVERPPALVLGKSRPDDAQKMQLFLSARRQTIHGGWLTEIMDIVKDEWKADYANARMTTQADNIVPESDNAPSESIVGKRPLSEEDVYYPRTDFRRKITSGELQKKLVAKKAEQVADDLRRTSLDQVLALVEVNGLGSALSGMRVSEFLSGLSLPSEDPVAYPSDLISDKYPHKRVFYPAETLPPSGSMNADTGQIQVQPGIELTAASWRVELSDPIHPLDTLRAFVATETKKDDGDGSSGVASVV
jgi:hypothetical protein